MTTRPTNLALNAFYIAFDLYLVALTGGKGKAELDKAIDLAKNSIDSVTWITDEERDSLRDCLNHLAGFHDCGYTSWDTVSDVAEMIGAEFF